MAVMECGQGHLYDTAQYSTCPYCNGAGNVINFDAPPVNKTVAPAAYRSALNIDSSGIPDNNSDKTVGVFGKKMQTEPVVGWLVCTEGADKGKDYRILGKINTIGRSENMDICIKGDDTVSRENHARIAYDPRHNMFQLIPAESTNNIYLNDMPVYAPSRLSAYDVVELGESRMVFVPLCCERFNWDEGINGSKQQTGKDDI